MTYRIVVTANAWSRPSFFSTRDHVFGHKTQTPGGEIVDFGASKEKWDPVINSPLKPESIFTKDQQKLLLQLHSLECPMRGFFRQNEWARQFLTTSVNTLPAQEDRFYAKRSAWGLTGQAADLLDPAKAAKNVPKPFRKLALSHFIPPPQGRVAGDGPAKKAVVKRAAWNTVLERQKTKVSQRVPPLEP